MMRCSSTAAGWLKLVGPSSSIGLADGEGDDERDSFVKGGEGAREGGLESAASGCEDPSSAES
jgi:hypothetical protein